MEKHHGVFKYRPVIYVVDEAKTVENEIFEAIMRIDPDFLLVVSTPGSEEGWLYNAIDPDSFEGVAGDDEDQVIGVADMSPEQIRYELDNEKRRLAEMDV